YFQKIVPIKDFKVNEKINSKVKNISLDNLNFFKNNTFHIFKTKNIYHLYTHQKITKEKNNKNSKIKEFNINSGGIKEMLNDIENFLNH
ncbi:MAG: hypothetical protein K2I76_03125, partial [Malacoplasma sp.]|nr:hypothetical protein [Malacoplasma sp.]